VPAERPREYQRTDHRSRIVHQKEMRGIKQVLASEPHLEMEIPFLCKSHYTEQESDIAQYLRQGKKIKSHRFVLIAILGSIPEEPCEKPLSALQLEIACHQLFDGIEGKPARISRGNTIMDRLAMGVARLSVMLSPLLFLDHLEAIPRRHHPRTYITRSAVVL